MHRLFVFCLILGPSLLLACSDELVMTIRVMVPDDQGRETPLAGTRLFFLPYDRDSVLRDLERQAPTPRPDTGRLDSLLGLFREPFVRYVGLTASRERVARAMDSVEARLTDLSSDVPERARLLEVSRKLQDSLTGLEAPLERARRRLDGVRGVLPEAESLRRRVAAWQDTAYRGLDSVTRLLLRSTRRDQVIDSTDAAGWATLSLEPGAWWVFARAVNVLDPNAQWSWNVRITSDTLILNSANGHSRPRLR